MSLTPDAAYDEILTFFKDVWDATTWLALYENVPGDKPEAGSLDPWARVQVRTVTGNQASLSGDLGTLRWDRGGNVIIQIFVPLGEGLSEAKQLVKIVLDAYEGVTTPNGVWFRNARQNEVGSDGVWHQTNVIVDFTYDEIK